MFFFSSVNVSRSLEKEKKSRGAWTKAGKAAGSSSSGEPGTSKESAHTESKGRAEATLPKSDAVLNCPACMTTLCLDCQRLVS